MSWRHLLFAHWPVEPARLRRLIPEPLELDVRDGAAWLGLVPFDMIIRPRWVPRLPVVSHLPEINVRTYVTFEGRPGIWFFSLDIGLRLAVAAARKFFHLPYYHATVRCDVTPPAGGASSGSTRRDDEAGVAGDWPVVSYNSERRHPGAPPAVFRGRYQPVSEVEYAAADSTTAWFTERYCLYTQGPGGRIGRCEIHHDPWPLQRAQWDVKTNAMLAPLGLPLPPQPPVLHYAERQDVVAWPLQWIA